MIFDNNGFVIDRIQRGGVSNYNIPLERINEVGNYQTVAVVRDIPDLTFTVETLDVSTELEAILMSPGVSSPDTATPASGTSFNYTNCQPIDIVSPFMAAYNSYTIVRGVAIPSLYLESVEYRYGIRANSTETYTFRGDSVYYTPGQPYIYKSTVGAPTTVFTFPNAPQTYVERGTARYALNVSVDGVRKFLGTDYTETTTAVTLLSAATTGQTVRIVYSSAVIANTYPQTVHASTTSGAVKPAAVRGKDIDVYMQSAGSTPVMVRWDGVQTATATRRITLQDDEEFGNYHYVARDYDTALVNGEIAVKPSDANNLWSKIAQVTGVSTTQVSGPFISSPIEIEIRVSNPDTGALIKTIYVPDARFTPPAHDIRVNQKATYPFRYESDSGSIYVFQGARPAGVLGP